MVPPTPTLCSHCSPGGHADPTLAPLLELLLSLLCRPCPSPLLSSWGSWGLFWALSTTHPPASARSPQTCVSAELSLGDTHHIHQTPATFRSWGGGRPGPPGHRPDSGHTRPDSGHAQPASCHSFIPTPGPGTHGPAQAPTSLHTAACGCPGCSGGSWCTPPRTLPALGLPVSLSSTHGPPPPGSLPAVLPARPLSGCHAN